MDPEQSTRPRHYCGLFGIYGHPNAAELTYYGLYALQHRGQESAGITASDGIELRTYKGMGLVGQVFDKNILRSLPGHLAIGHVRYSTTGSSNIKNAQPLVVDCARGQIAIGHNGNLTNAARLRAELEEQGSIFQTTVDSEIILHLLARPFDGDRAHSLEAVMQRIQGAYSLVIMGEDELIGVRDPFGFRPLVLGKLTWTEPIPPQDANGMVLAENLRERVNTAHVLASETCALDLIQAEFVRDIEPGEIIVINKDGVRSVNPWKGTQQPHSLCIFEFVYFARPDSDLQGQQRRPGPHQPRPRPRPRASRRGRPRHPRARQRQLGGDGIRRGQRHPLRQRVRPQPLHRPHVPATEPAHPRFWRPRETQPD